MYTVNCIEPQYNLLVTKIVEAINQYVVWHKIIQLTFCLIIYDNFLYKIYSFW